MMTRVPLYNHVKLDGKATGLYELVGHAVNGTFVRNSTVSPLKTRAQWQAIDQAQSAQQPSRKVSLTTAIAAALTEGVPPPPTMRDIVNYQRRQRSAEPLPAPAPLLHTNVGVPPPPRTMEAVVALQRERGILPPADVREVKVQSHPHHRLGQCWACHWPELQCHCPTVAPIGAHYTAVPRQPEPMLCRHCQRTLCICQIETPSTMARVVARQAELRNLTT